jgi:hypothetical protein
MPKLTIFFIGLICLSSCARGQKEIITRGAYVTIRQPGTLAVDDLGNIIQSRPDSVFTIYVEVGAKKIDWGVFWRGKKSYMVIPTLAESLPITMVREEGQGKQKELPVSKGNKLWQLELVPYEKKLTPPSSIKPGQILMKGKYGSKPFSIVITNIIVVESPPSY